MSDNASMDISFEINLRFVCVWNPRDDDLVDQWVVGEYLCLLIELVKAGIE